MPVIEFFLIFKLSIFSPVCLFIKISLFVFGSLIDINSVVFISLFFSFIKLFDIGLFIIYVSSFVFGSISFITSFIISPVFLFTKYGLLFLSVFISKFDSPFSLFTKIFLFVFGSLTYENSIEELFIIFELVNKFSLLDFSFFEIFVSCVV